MSNKKSADWLKLISDTGPQSNQGSYTIESQVPMWLDAICHHSGIQVWKMPSRILNCNMLKLFFSSPFLTTFPHSFANVPSSSKAQPRDCFTHSARSDPDRLKVSAKLSAINVDLRWETNFMCWVWSFYWTQIHAFHFNPMHLPESLGSVRTYLKILKSEY